MFFDVFCLSVWKSSENLVILERNSLEQIRKGKEVAQKLPSILLIFHLNHCFIFFFILYFIAVELLSGPSSGFLRVIIWAKFVKKTLLFKRHYKIGVSAPFFWQKVCHNIWRVLSGPSWPSLCCNKLGPDNNPYLAQTITLQNGQLFLFVLLPKMCWNT